MLGPAHNAAMAPPLNPANPVPCPRCLASMAVLSLEAHYGQRLELDDCATCRLSWFDARELMRVSPAAWRALLRHLASSHAEPLPEPRTGALQCPRCAVRLEEQQDLTRMGAFPMKACPAGHGRAQGHASLLASRGLFRRLLPDERASLAQEQRHFDCLGCGAPQDGQRDACAHCGTAPIVVDWPRLADAIGLLPAPEGDAAALKQRAWSCHGCGAALDPVRHTRCPQCQHPVLAPDLSALLPWLERAELAPPRPAPASTPRDAASREAVRALVQADGGLPPLDGAAWRRRVQALGAAAFVAAWVWGPLALALASCLGYTMLARLWGERVALLATGAGAAAVAAWAWRGRVLTADGDPAWVVLALAGGVVGWGLARLARVVHRLLLA